MYPVKNGYTQKNDHKALREGCFSLSQSRRKEESYVSDVLFTDEKNDKIYRMCMCDLLPGQIARK